MVIATTASSQMPSNIYHRSILGIYHLSQPPTVFCRKTAPFNDTRMLQCYNGVWILTLTSDMTIQTYSSLNNSLYFSIREMGIGTHTLAGLPQNSKEMAFHKSPVGPGT